MIAKLQNQDPKLTTQEVETYSYYPFSYYSGTQSLKSSKGKKNTWDAESLIRLSNSMGGAFALNVKNK